MKKKKIRCQYCGSRAHRRPDSVVRGKWARGVKLYICDRYPACDAYVGVHKDTGKPYGTLANKALRNKRRQAHEIFDVLWKSGMMSKAQAYVWMQDWFALKEEEAHIGMFTEEMCDALIEACESFLSEVKIAA